MKLHAARGKDMADIDFLTASGVRPVARATESTSITTPAATSIELPVAKPDANSQQTVIGPDPSATLCLRTSPEARASYLPRAPNPSSGNGKTTDPHPLVGDHDHRAVVEILVQRREIRFEEGGELASTPT